MQYTVPTRDVCTMSSNIKTVLLPLTICHWNLRIHHHTVNEVKRRSLCMNCALSHPPRQCPAYKYHCLYCDAIEHWEKCCREKKYDSRQKSDGRRQKVVCLVLSCVLANTPMESNGQVQCRQEHTSKSRSRSDFSRSPKPIDELSGYTTENDRDDNDADVGDYTESFYIITIPLRKAAQPPCVLKCIPTSTLVALISLVYMTSN